MGRVIRNIKKIKQLIFDFSQYRKRRGIYACNVSYLIDSKRFMEGGSSQEAQAA